MGDHLRLHLGDLSVERADDRGQRAHDRRVGAGDHRWLAQVLGAQCGRHLRGPLVRVAPPSPGQRASDARP
jgi:hypothetical protein